MILLIQKPNAWNLLLVTAEFTITSTLVSLSISSGETAQSIEAPKGCSNSPESGKMCGMSTCFSCNSIREAQAQTVRGTILIPCRMANRGSFPLNGTYFQINEVFADHASSCNPIDVPRDWIWKLERRTVYFGTSVTSIFRGLTTEAIQLCFRRVVKMSEAEKDSNMAERSQKEIEEFKGPSSSPDSENEKSSIPTRTGRKQPVHAVFGGGKTDLKPRSTIRQSSQYNGKQYYSFGFCGCFDIWIDAYTSREFTKVRELCKCS